jgi:hypothetical protein
MDLRERVVSALDEGESSLEVAMRFGVSDSWVRKQRLEPSVRGVKRISAALLSDWG